MELIDENTLNKMPLPTGWAWATLDSVAEIQSGAGFPKAFQGQVEGEYPFAKISDITDAVLNHDGMLSRAANYVCEEVAATLRAKVYPVGSVLFAKIGEAIRSNRRAMVTVKLLADNNVMGLLAVGKAILPKYLLFFMHTVDLYEYSRATTVPSVRKSDVADIPIPLAPSREQRRVVEAIETHFSRLDAGVTTLKTLQTKLGRYRAAVLKAACEGTLLPPEEVQAIRESPDYEPAEQLLQRILAERRQRWEAEQIARGKNPARLKYKEPRPPDTENLPPLPAGWVWASVQQLSENIQYGYTESARHEPIGPKFLRITDIQHGQVDWSSVPYCRCEQERFEKYRLYSGDMVFARTGATTGKSYLITDCPHAVFASYLIRLRFGERLNSRYFALFFDAPLYWSQIMSVRKGSAQPGVNATILATLRVPLPPLQEQTRVVAEVERRLSIVDEVSAAIGVNLRRADRLRQSILKEAFAGRLVPQDPNDEPASELLKRIQAEREQRAAMDKRK